MTIVNSNMKKITAILIVLSMSACATTFKGHEKQTNILDCTVKMAKETGAHVVDSSNICINAYSFDNEPRTELKTAPVEKTQ